MPQLVPLLLLLCWVVGSTATPPPYNMINYHAYGFDQGLSTEYATPGTGMASIHPNPEERSQFQVIVQNARLFPEEHALGRYGNRLYGTQGPSYPDGWTYDTGGSCGLPATKPYWFHPGGNEGARFHTWSCFDCNSSCGHNTCSDPDHCARFGGECGFGPRTQAFMQTGFASSEGLCGSNLCLSGGHCGAYFDDSRWWIGMGFWPYSNGLTNVYIRDETYPIEAMHPIPSGAHFDERTKCPSSLRVSGIGMRFMATWFGNHHDGKAQGYVAYQGALHEMELLYGNHTVGTWFTGFATPTSCEPYYFVFVTEAGNVYTLPEQADQFMFGTAWSPWSWWSPNNPCEENHYYIDPDSNVVVNGGPGLTATLPTNCTGCANVPSILTSTLLATPPTPEFPTPTPIPTPGESTGSSVGQSGAAPSNTLASQEPGTPSAAPSLAAGLALLALCLACL